MDREQSVQHFLDLLKEIKMQLIFVLIKIPIVLNPWKKEHIV